MTVTREAQSPEFTGIELLAQLVTSVTGVTVSRMQSSQRGNAVSEARKMLSEMAFDLDYSKSEIARFMKKDHTTIGYHLRGRE